MNEIEYLNDQIIQLKTRVAALEDRLKPRPPYDPSSHAGGLYEGGEYTAW